MNRALLDKFLRGEVTAAERSEVEQWLEEQPEAWLDNFLETTDANMAPVLSPEERAGMIGRVMNRVQPKLRVMRILRVAAMLTGLLILAGGAFYFSQRPKAPLADLTVSVPFRTMKKVTLPDSTVIVLNAGSTLRYPPVFSASTREVTLEGEAFFEVAPDPRKPFIIHAGALNTTVLGTSFNISAYKNAVQVSVTVLTGKVAVMDTLSQQSVTLLPKQKVTLNAGTAALLTSIEEKPENAMAWSNGQLIFEETPLGEVMETLSRRYNVRITLTDQRLAGYRFNGAFETESLEDILKIITTLTKTSIKREGATIELVSKGSPRYK